MMVPNLEQISCYLYKEALCVCSLFDVFFCVISSDTKLGCSGLRLLLSMSWNEHQEDSEASRDVIEAFYWQICQFIHRFYLTACHWTIKAMKRGSLLTLKMLHDNLFIICYQYIYFYLFFKMKLISLHSESNHLKTYMTVYIKDFCPPFINALLMSYVVFQPLDGTVGLLFVWCLQICRQW